MDQNFKSVLLNVMMSKLLVAKPMAISYCGIFGMSQIQFGQSRLQLIVVLNQVEGKQSIIQGWFLNNRSGWVFLIKKRPRLVLKFIAKTSPSEMCPALKLTKYVILNMMGYIINPRNISPHMISPISYRLYHKGFIGRAYQK